MAKFPFFHSIKMFAEKDWFVCYLKIKHYHDDRAITSFGERIRHSYLTTMATLKYSGNKNKNY